ncbi:MAG: beta-propeller fold lactonase family protein [Stenotrophobium sp.]
MNLEARNIPTILSVVWRSVVLALISLILNACGGGGTPTSISLSTNSLSFTVAPQSNISPSQILTVHYSGSGVVVGYAPGITPLPELSITPIDTSTPGVATFQLTMTAIDQAPGSYSTKVRFVTGTVPAGGTIADATNVVYADLQVNETALDLHSTPNELNLTYTDGGPKFQTGTITLAIGSGEQWTASADAPWLTVTPSGNGPGTISYSIDTSGLTEGNHPASVLITDGSGNTAAIPVDVGINVPLLVTNPATPTIAVGSNMSPAALTLPVTITDTLGGSNPAKILSWSLQSVGADFLSVTPTSGTSTPNTQIQLSINPQPLARLANGNYATNFILSYTTEEGIQRDLIVSVVMQLNSPLASISLTPATPTTISGYGLSVPFTATGTNVDGYPQDLTAQVNWTSSNPTIATIGTPTASVAQPVAPGTTTITASLPGSTITGSTSLTVQSAVGYAYTLTSQSVAQYVYGANGVLVPMATPSVATGTNPRAMVVSPNRQFLYVTNTGDNTISQFSIGTNGALTPLASPAVSTGSYIPTRITEDASGKYVYPLMQFTSTQNIAMQYSVGIDGSLTPLSTPSVNTGAIPFSIVADTTGPYAYVSNLQDNTLSQYSIGNGGNLTPLSPSTVATGPDPFNLVSAPSGQNIYALVYPVSTDNESPPPIGSVQQFSIGTNGVLTLHSTATAGVAPSGMTLLSSGQYAYVLNDGIPGPDYSSNASIYLYSVGADGSLAPLSGETSIPLSGAIDGVIASDPQGKYVYVDNNFLISQFSVNADGSLTLLNNNTTGGVSSLAFIPIN